MSDGQAAERTGVTARLTGAGRFQVSVEAQGAAIVADEPVQVGGLGSGPTPYELLSAGLAACTAMTLNLYALRKGWDLSGLSVEVMHARIEGADRFTRQIGFGSALNEEQRARLLEIADRCPVHQTLERRSEIVTLTSGAAGPAAGAEPPGQHEKDMEEACAGIE